MRRIACPGRESTFQLQIGSQRYRMGAVVSSRLPWSRIDCREIEGIGGDARVSGGIVYGEVTSSCSGLFCGVHIKSPTPGGVGLGNDHVWKRGYD